MQCPECVKEGMRSRVFPQGSSITLMSSQPFYDEEGTYHNHDGNIIKEAYLCSRDHRWNKRFNRPCPAGDWPVD